MSPDRSGLGVSRAFLVTCIALFTGAAAYAVALVWLPSARLDGHYVPVGVDSFYHARRILDTIANPGSFYEFDPHIHAPEGSWITWPWGYDRLVAWTVLGIQRLSGAQDPMAILVYIPPTWAFVNAALLIAIGSTLGLQLGWLVLLGAAFAFSSLTQILHGVGVIDHHYVEYTFVLATILAALRWLQAPAEARRAALLGAVLGLAPAFHNGLFSLQIPVDLTLLILWLRGALPAARSVTAFALALLVATLAAVLPSEPFRAGQFSFATLSWFHLYIASLTGLGAVYLSRRARSPLNFAVLAAFGAAALVPIASEVVTGSRFLSATLVKLDQIGEALSLRELFIWGGIREITILYSAWIVLLPLTALVSVGALLRRTTPPPWIFAAVFALFGGALLCFQGRLHYFGSPALFLGPLLGLQFASARLRPALRTAATVVGAGTLVAGYQPVMTELWTPVPVAWDFDHTYEIYARDLYPRLRAACAEHPGIVLADSDDGHYIRFNTDCSVISNNFILTPLHERKLLETEHLLTLSAREIIDRYPYVDYIFVHRPADPEGLRGELLFGDGPYPDELRLVAQVNLRTESGGQAVLARVFRIERRPKPGPGAPASGGEKG